MNYRVQLPEFDTGIGGRELPVHAHLPLVPFVFPGRHLLPQLLQAEAQAGIRRSHKAVIMIFLPGGPSHQDIFDLKMDAPSEIRGEFKPISTAVPGIQICEHLPLLAKMMDKLVLIRSMVGAEDRHDAVTCLTGRHPRKAPPGGWPVLIADDHAAPLDPGGLRTN